MKPLMARNKGSFLYQIRQQQQQRSENKPLSFNLTLKNMSSAFGRIERSSMKSVTDNEIRIWKGRERQTTPQIVLENLNFCQSVSSSCQSDRYDDSHYHPNQRGFQNSGSISRSTGRTATAARSAAQICSQIRMADVILVCKESLKRDVRRKHWKVLEGKMKVVRC